jgi:hypothetical protein
MLEKTSRAILPLLKARVTAITEGGFIITFGFDHGSPTTIKIVTDTRVFDLHDGDLVTLYTEVLLKSAKGNG